MELTHRYSFPDRFVSGAVGGPERRVFFVQTRQGSRMTNVVCERGQIKVLAEHLQRVLAELERAGAASGPGPRATGRPVDTDPLDVPLDEDFEAYQVEILDDGEPVRTLPANDAEFFYTDSMEVADFGGAQPSISFRVRQRGRKVALGIAAEATIEL